MKIQGDEKLSGEEKSKQVAAMRTEIANLEEMQRKAEADPFRQCAAA